jgi:Na+/proline symporter
VLFERGLALQRLRLNRTQGLVLGFFVLAWASLVTILVATPEVYDQALQLSASSDRRLFKLGFLAALSVFLVLLGVGVVRRWRWTFWLIVVAFIAGALRVPASILQLSGVLRAESPAWYLLLQAFIGLLQVAIGLAMLAGYRRSGVWGSL